MSPKQIGAFEAKTHFSALIHAAEHGQTVIVTKNGRPVAQIGPVPESEPSLEPAQALNALFSINARLRDIKLRDLVEEGRRF